MTNNINQRAANRNLPWSRNELILALDLYFRVNPIHTSAQHPEVLKLSDFLNKLPTDIKKSRGINYRNPDGVYMKMCNFLHLDPSYHGTGLKSVSKLDKSIWNEFSNNRDQLSTLAAEIWSSAIGVKLPPVLRGKGHVYTINNIFLVNGVINYLAQNGPADLSTLDRNQRTTIKSGKAQHPKRVKELSRFAEALGLVNLVVETVELTPFGHDYASKFNPNIWELSDHQARQLREYVLEDKNRNPDIFAINVLYQLIKTTDDVSVLKAQYAEAIGKDSKWKSPVTSSGFLHFGLNYLKELGLLDHKRYRVLKERNNLFYEEDKIETADYQFDVQTSEPATVDPGPQRRPEAVREHGHMHWKTNPGLGKKCIIASAYKCEVDSSHKTFKSKASGNQYMEAHHLIPMAAQDDFKWSLDVPANIISVCPNCHRLLHHAQQRGKLSILSQLFDKKRTALLEAGLNPTFSRLKTYYK